jgi:hypothetical protein
MIPSPIRRFALGVLLAASAWHASAQQAHPWWQAFHETTLDLLLANAGPGGDDRAQRLAFEARATSAYLKARVYSVRLETARVLVEVSAREMRLLEAEGDSPELVRARLWLDECERRGHAFLVLRTESIAELAEALHDHPPAEVLAGRLQSTLSEPRLPMPDYALPEALSGLVLRQRPDVQAAEQALVVAGRDSASDQLRLARYLQALAQDIRPEDRDVQPSAIEDDHLAQVMQQARSEVAGRLAQVQEGGRRADAQLERVRLLARRQEAQSASGHVPEREALRAMREVLVAQDWLAVAVGVADLDWVAFQVSIGGAGQARLDELLGARREEE